MTGARNILWLLPLLLLVSWPIWGERVTLFLSPHESFNSSDKASVPPPRNFSMDDVVFLQDKQGQRDWRIVTKRLHTVGDQSKLQMESIDAVVFREQESRFHIISDSGLYDTEAEVLTLTDNVEVKTAEGYKIKTPVLQYHERGQKIKTESAVDISGKDIKIKGRGLTYDMQSGAYRIGGRLYFEAR